MEFKKKWEKIEWRSAWEKLYLCVLALHIVRLVFDSSLFNIQWPTYYDQIFKLIILAVLFLKLGYMESYKSLDWIFCISVGAAFALSWIYTEYTYTFLADFALLLIGSKGVSYRKILKVYFWSAFIVISITIIGALTGCIKDIIYVKGETYRHSFGIGYTTSFAAHIFYLSLTFWVLYSKNNMVFGVIAGILAFFLYTFCDARCSTVTMILLSICSFYTCLIEKFKSKLLLRIDEILKKIFVILLPVCAAIAIIASIKYNQDETFIQTLDEIFSRRLSLTHTAIEKYGIQWFGTVFEMVGSGGDAVYRPDYFYIDSSYALILLNYGIIVFLIVCILYIYITKKAKNNGQRKWVFAMAIIAIHNIVEDHLLSLAFNPFMLLAFADVVGDDSIEEKKEITSRIIRKYAVYAAVFSIIAINIFRFIGLGRTIVTIQSLNQTENHIYFITAVFWLIITGFIFVRYLIKVFDQSTDKLSVSKKNGSIIVISGLIFVFSMFHINEKIEEGAFLYENSMEENALLIRELQENQDAFKFYVEDVPQLYKKKFGKISEGILLGNSHVKEENVVLITNINNDLSYLINKGFLFGELSDTQGIYCNSDDALEIIQKNGIEMNNCYSVRKEVDLQNMADDNNLVYDADKGVLVEGREKSLIYGPWETVYSGKLRVTYRLKLESGPEEAKRVAKLRVSASWGKKIYQEKELYPEDFDDEGYCISVLDQNIYNSEGMEFLIFADNDTKLWVESITYEKIPK